MSEFLKCWSSACLPSFNLYFCVFSDTSEFPFTVSQSFYLSTFPTACPCASSAKFQRFLKAGSQSTFLSTFPTACPFICNSKFGVKIFACLVSPSYSLPLSVSRSISKIWVNLFACLPSCLPVLQSVQKYIILSEIPLCIRNSLSSHNFPVY